MQVFKDRQTTPIQEKTTTTQTLKSELKKLVVRVQPLTKRWNFQFNLLENWDTHTYVSKGTEFFLKLAILKHI